MKPIDLPLAADRHSVEGAGGVSFAIDVGERQVPCYVTRAVLESYFGAEAEAGDDSPGLRAFDRHANLIHQLAREQWERRGPGVPAVVLTVDAVFRSLTRG